MLDWMILSAAAAEAALSMYFNRPLAEGYARQQAAIERRQQQADCHCPPCSGRRSLWQRA
jgi:hypothetical protein